MILGDPAYPALPWLMKPYPENGFTTSSQKLYNYRQSRARMVVENSFGRLKGRWRCLSKRLDSKLKHVVDIVAACVTLHNMCEMIGDAFLMEWNSLQNAPTQPIRVNQDSSSVDGAAVRDAIMQHINNTST